MTEAQTMIEVEGLTKLYGPIRAIEGLNFHVMRGEVLGFLGPNGAGKTTTMKILTGFIAPTQGQARVAGHDVVDDSLEVRKNLGYLPENAPLYHDMVVKDYLDFVAEVRRIPQADRKKRLGRVVETCGLGDVYGRPIGELSKGFRQRVGLAQAMIHDPNILILDEPTSGLDPNQIVEIRELIKELGRERTVILSTHNLSEVQMTCQRVIIIHRGKIVADGKQEDLQAAQSGHRSDVVLSLAGLKVEDARAGLKAIPGVTSVEPAPRSAEGEVGFVVTSSSADDPRPLIFRKAVESGWTLLELKREIVNLEQIFRQLTLEHGKTPDRN